MVTTNPISPLTERDTEIIAVVINGEQWETYEAFAGTFASFTYACLVKHTLPGFADEDVLAAAALTGRRLFLTIKGRNSRDELARIMDKALSNILAFPGGGRGAGCFIEAVSEA